jgi:hypothetical protein
MIIMMAEERVKDMPKRLRKVLRGLGVELRHFACLELAARLCGIDGWRNYLGRDLDEPLSLLDDELSNSDFAERDEFQMKVLEAAGFGAVARELLDRANPTGSWVEQSSENPVSEYVGGNDPGRWSEDVPAPADG